MRRAIWRKFAAEVLNRGLGTAHGLVEDHPGLIDTEEVTGTTNAVRRQVATPASVQARTSSSTSPEDGKAPDFPYCLSVSAATAQAI